MQSCQIGQNSTNWVTFGSIGALKSVFGALLLFETMATALGAIIRLLFAWTIVPPNS